MSSLKKEENHMKNTIKAIAALIISATMISITACGNTDNVHKHKQW